MFALCGSFVENAYSAIICFFPTSSFRSSLKTHPFKPSWLYLRVWSGYLCVCMHVCVFVFGDDVVGLFPSVQLWVVVFSYCDLLFTFSSNVLQWKNDIRKRMHC